MSEHELLSEYALSETDVHGSGLSGQTRQAFAALAREFSGGAGFTRDTMASECFAGLSVRSSRAQATRVLGLLESRGLIAPRPLAPTFYTLTERGEIAALGDRQEDARVLSEVALAHEINALESEAPAPKPVPPAFSPWRTPGESLFFRSAAA